MIAFKLDTSPLKQVVEKTLEIYNITYAQSIVNAICDGVNKKFELLGVSYLAGIETIETARAIMQVTAGRDMPTLLAMTNNLEELASIPTDDKTTRTFEQATNAFSMNEDSPIDNTESITTPFVKSKTNSGNKYTDTVKHNTVLEAVKRQKIAGSTVYTLMTFCEKLLESVIEEFNTAY